MGENLGEILSRVGMLHLKENFEEQRIEIEDICSASDEDLSKLGVSTIGDRLRLKQACRIVARSTLNSASATSASQARLQQRGNSEGSGSSSASRINNSLKERSVLFNRCQSRKRTKQKKTRGRSWTVSFMCLASRYSCKVPDSYEKVKLQKAGLGFKKIKLEIQDTEEAVFNKITSNEKLYDDVDNSYVGFPQLKTCGGFELMTCLSNSKDLKVLNTKLSAKDIKASIGGSQSKIYLRPIQENLSTQSILIENNSSLKETCKTCSGEFLISELRTHVRKCNKKESNVFDEIFGMDAVLLSPEDDSSSSEDSFLNEPAFPHNSANNNDSIPEEPNKESSVEEELQPNINNNHQENMIINIEIDGKHQTDDEQENNPVLEKVHGKCTSIQEIIQEISNDELAVNPVEVLRSFQRKVMIGRPLEITDQTVEPIGETNCIMVDRNDILRTGFSELEFLENKFVTLEVQFYAEVRLLIYIIITLLKQVLMFHLYRPFRPLWLLSNKAAIMKEKTLCTI